MTEASVPRRALIEESTSHSDAIDYDEVITDPFEGFDIPDDGSFDVVQDGSSPFTQEVGVDNPDPEAFNEPIPGDQPTILMPSLVSAVIRTVTPMVVGGILFALAYVLTPLGVAVPEALAPWLDSTMPIALGSAYFIAAKFLERKFPTIPWLGSTRKPVYFPSELGGK